MKDYDYSQEGSYFITLLTFKRRRFFGVVRNNEMFLSDAGKIAEKCWLAIPEHFPNVVLHEFIIMPDHIHGVIELRADKLKLSEESSIPRERKKSLYGKMIPRSVGSIVKGYKIGVTKWFRANTQEYKVWHRDYYDVIIRNNEAYLRITEYIRNNPMGGYRADKGG